ncbi:MAG: DUF2019 domain-containing protein [Rhizobiales bacterium]|nr:DUF2019 domain-containing protein [Hyphomicrobiales bacterium]
MRRINLAGLSEITVDQLVQRFTVIALDQHRAILDDDNAKFTRLYRQMEAAELELKTRIGDQRRALLRLHNHQNAQVRLTAAIATLAVAPDAARRVLQNINDRAEFPQAADALGMIRALDDGTYVPN